MVDDRPMSTGPRARRVPTSMFIGQHRAWQVGRGDHVDARVQAVFLKNFRRAHARFLEAVVEAQRHYVPFLRIIGAR